MTLRRPGPTWLLLIALLLAAAATIGSAMLRTSTTFDEIVMIAGGARGFETGDWHLVPEHPPVVQYLYGLPVHLAGVQLPDETGIPDDVRSAMGYRYRYAQQLFWRSGNDPERLARFGRIPALLCALGLILLVFCYGRTLAGDAVGLLAALLTAALPDVLAHGGVAYNDVPLALTFLGAVWAIDSAVRTASVRRAILAGALIGLALGIKNSAVALGPVGILLLLAELGIRRRDRAWLRRIVPAAAATAAAAYVMLVLVYRLDPSLAEYRYAVDFAFGHVTRLAVPSYLLGEVSLHGWWYFFPAAFLFKTPAGLHLLVAAAAIHFIGRAAREPQRIVRSPLRGPFLALAVFGVLLLTSDLNIGFRYALPALPLLCLLTAAAVVRVWRASGRPVRAALAVATVWTVVHVATYYPFFLSYMSEYGPGEARAYEVLADSSLDWGHGLLELRDFMREHDVPAVRLSYFGSALPEGYGIRYVPMSSFFVLPAQPPLDRTPEWVAISATNLSGPYVANDPYAAFRTVRPDRVLARSIFLYHLPE